MVFDPATGNRYTNCPVRCLRDEIPPGDAEGARDSVQERHRLLDRPALGEREKDRIRAAENEGRAPPSDADRSIFIHELCNETISLPQDEHPRRKALDGE